MLKKIETYFSRFFSKLTKKTNRLFLDIIWIFSYFTEEYDEVNGVGPTFLTKLIVALSTIAKGFSAVIIHNKNKILNF